MSAVEPRTIVDMCAAAARLLRDYEWHDTNIDRVDGEGYSCSRYRETTYRDLRRIVRERARTK